MQGLGLQSDVLEALGRKSCVNSDVPRPPRCLIPASACEFRQTLDQPHEFERVSVRARSTCRRHQKQPSHRSLSGV